ncbi:hypothetical protein DV737_g1891, partial [Chaetothyriales sp. CBS 132003]
MKSNTSDISSSKDLEATHSKSIGEVLSVNIHDDSKIFRKVDWRIVPIMFACYFLQFLDKVLINYANVMGLPTDLGFKGNDFPWMATAFFIGYAVAEFPQGYMLQKFPLAKVLGFNVLGWGITIACSAGAQDFKGMVALRTLLGCFESVISPALVMNTSQWYTKREAGPRYGIWYCGLGAGQIIGGLISFAAQHGAKNASFGGWRIMMLSVGIFNIGTACVVLAFLPDTVDSAKFLTAEEKASIHRKLALDQAGNGAKVFHPSSLWEIFLDLQVWLLFLLTILIVIPSGVITTFSATLIKGFGYTPKESALLNMPSGIISIASTLMCTFAILRGSPRWLSIILLLIPTVIGAGLMSFIDKNNQAGKLAGIYLINTIVAPLAIIYTWVGANMAGYTKRVASNAVIAIGFSIANIIGPQTFQSQDAPDYIPAKITIFGVAGGALIISLLLRILYGFRNKRNVQFRRAQLEELSSSASLIGPEVLQMLEESQIEGFGTPSDDSADSIIDICSSLLFLNFIHLSGNLKLLHSRYQSQGFHVTRSQNESVDKIEKMLHAEPTSIKPPSIVIVTGANGFIASHTIHQLLQQGFKVVGTVRSRDKAEAVRKTHSELTPQCIHLLSTAVVPDITDPEAYMSLFQSTNPAAVLHLASPFGYTVTDFERDLLQPAVRGTEAVLRAAAQTPSIQRVVHTNSFACIYDSGLGARPGYVYTAKDWSPLTYEDGMKALNAPAAYRASKAVAEKTAWAFMGRSNSTGNASPNSSSSSSSASDSGVGESALQPSPGFDLVSLCPAMVFGPFLPTTSSLPSKPSELNTSNALVWEVVSAGSSSPVPPTKGPVWVDVRDVATAHLCALSSPSLGGRRLLLANGVYCTQEIADVAREITAASMGSTWKTATRGKAHSKAVAQGKLVETANDLSMPDFMSRYAPTATGPLPTGSDESIRYTDGTNISRDELQACLNLVEQTSAEDYANSEVGWSRAKKRKEMVLPDLKYILLLSESQAGVRGYVSDGGQGGVVGFISFMITYEDGEEVIYIYEVHLQPPRQGKGYGRRLMDYVEAIGQSVGVKKAMLTVFRSNQRAVGVYERLGYEEDEFSPKPRQMRNGTVKEASYVILSKMLQNKVG